MARATVQPLLDAITHHRTPGAFPFVVAIDGRSGAGKSTLARRVAEAFPPMSGAPFVVVIEGDEFYAGGSAAHWDRQSPAGRASMVIDWRRQRPVLQQLREGTAASWYAFDWNADDWDTDVVPLHTRPSIVEPAPVVVLEGAYSARPELHDLLDLKVLLDPPEALRRRQLLDREGEDYRADWASRWSAAEEHYFGNVMPPERFDLVLRPDDQRSDDQRSDEQRSDEQRPDDSGDG